MTDVHARVINNFVDLSDNEADVYAILDQPSGQCKYLQVPMLINGRRILANLDTYSCVSFGY
jgi:hypothetical protein